ncbi:MAG: fibronectin type III domain-containing protein [Bacteroidota bacterium]
MKQLVFIILSLLCLAPFNGWSQQFPVQVNTTLAPPYSLYLSDYSAVESPSLQVLVSLLELDRTNLKVKLRVTLEGAGITLRTRPSYVPPAIVLQGGVPELLTGFDLRQYLNPDNLEFSGISRAAFIQSGRLPEGFYTLTIEVLDYNRSNLISNASMANAWIILNDPPFINTPFNQSKPMATDPQNIMFSWTPRHTASPNAAFSTEYEFKLVEMYPGQVDPEVAIRSSNSIYTTTTTQTALNYGVIEPTLIPGRSYAFRVRAYDTGGRDLFKNDGFSETYVFQYGDKCILPANIEAASIDPNRIRIDWEPETIHSGFSIDFRRSGNTEWYAYTNYGSGQVIPELESGTTYEYRIQPKCGTIYGEQSDIYTVETPADAFESDYGFACGTEPPDLDLNPNLLQKSLEYRDLIKASDWTIRVESAKTTATGTYSGTGFATVPFFKLASVRVKFDNIKVNEDYYVIDGMIHTVYSENSDFVTDLTEPDDPAFNDEDPSEGEGGADDGDAPADVPVVVVDGTIDTIYHNEEGEIVIENTDGTVIVQEGGATSITDEAGNEYEVDEEGDVTAVGGAGSGAGSGSGAGGIAGGGGSGQSGSISHSGIRLLKEALTLLKQETDWSEKDRLMEDFAYYKRVLQSSLEEERDLSKAYESDFSGGEILLINTSGEGSVEDGHSLEFQGETLMERVSVYEKYKKLEKEYNTFRFRELLTKEALTETELKLVGGLVSVEGSSLEAYSATIEEEGDGEAAEKVKEAVLQLIESKF